MDKADKITMICATILTLLAIIIITPNVSAQSLVFKQCDLVDVQRPCFNDGAYCGASTTCNATIYYPNQTILVDDGNMTNNRNYYNYPIDGCLPLGDYKVDMTCTDGTDSGAETFWFKVTSTGDDRGFALILVLAFASLILLAFGIYTSNPFLGFIAGLTFFMLGIYVRIYGFSNVNDIYTQTIGYVGIGLGLLFTIVASWEWAINVKD